nr:unnamed protein product [Haemonchus contortus]
MQSTLAILLFTLKAVNGISFSADVFSCFIYHPSRFLERSGTRSEGRLQNVTTCLERCIEVAQILKRISSRLDKRWTGNADN